MAVPLHDLQDGVFAQVEALGDDPVGELLLLDHADHLRRQAIRLRPLPWLAPQLAAAMPLLMRSWISSRGG